MSSRTWRFAAVALMVVALAGPLAAGSSAASADAISPQTPGNVSSPPRTNGNIVVWAEEPSPYEIQSDVFGENLKTGQTFTIAGGPQNQIQPDVDGNIAVWLVTNADCPPCDEIHARDIDNPNATEFVVAASGALINAPAVSGHWVAWESNNSIRVRDIATMSDPVTVVMSDPGWGLDPVAIDGDRIVWCERSAGPNHTLNWQLKTKLITAGNAQIVAAGIFYSGQSVSYALSGNLVVYSVATNDPVQGSLMAVDVNTGSQTTIASAAAYPTTDGRYVFWQSSNGQRARLLGFDRSTRSTFEVPGPAFANGMPDLKGGALVWLGSPETDFIGATMDVEVGWMSQVLPTGQRPDPATTSPNWLYFTETSHYVANGFKDFWAQSGGLAVFGYPLTEEFSEAAPAQSRAETVQYFERQRFEYHPENQGTPYETELGRLGAEDANVRNLVVTQPFQPLPMTRAGDCQFFADTQHSACGLFLSYWQQHGLEFGDPGVSYRESLALFGYPISEPYVDQQTGLTVQYFERARFEYHPNNPDPYKVLLGRLGADVLAQRGW